MSVNEKPVASTGMRVLVAFIGLLASIFILVGITVAIQYRSMMFWTTSGRLGISISTLAIINGGISLCLLFLYPLLGFLIGQFGKAKFMAAGIVLTGCSVALLQIASNLSILVISTLLGTVGAALVYSGLLAYMMESISSRWFLACTAAGYVAIGVSVGIATNSFQSLPKDANGFFLVALASATLGFLFGGGLMLAHWLIHRRYQWPDEWLNEPIRPFSGINLALLLVLSLAVAIASGTFSQGFLYFALNYDSVADTTIVLQRTWLTASLIGSLAGGVLGDLCHWLSCRFFKRAFGRPAILLLGLLVALIGVILVIAIGKTLPLARIAVVVAGIGFSLFLPALLAYLAVQVRHQRRALLISGYLAVGILASVLASFTMGFIGQATGSNGLFVTTAMGLAVSIGLAIVILILSLIRKTETTGQITNSLVKET